MLSKVPYKDGFIFRPRGDDRGHIVVPSKRAHPGIVASERSDLLHGVNIPNLQISTFSSHAQVAAMVRPAQGSHLVVLSNVTEFLYAGGCRIPNVNKVLKSNSQNILRGPVNKVQVEIVTEARRLKHAVGVLGNLAGLGLDFSLAFDFGGHEAGEIDEIIVVLSLEANLALKRIRNSKHLVLLALVTQHPSTEQTLLGQVLANLQRLVGLGGA